MICDALFGCEVQEEALIMVMRSKTNLIGEVTQGQELAQSGQQMKEALHYLIQKIIKGIHLIYPKEL